MALILSVPFSLLACLQDYMPPFLGSASGVRGTDETAAAPVSLSTTWTHLLFVLIIIGVLIGGGLNLFSFGVSSSARPRSLCGPVPAARVHRPIKGCSSENQCITMRYFILYNTLQYCSILYSIVLIVYNKIFC